jgi:small subunit ribosomal protein S20
MAQIKSQMKRNLTNEKARQANASAKSEIRTQAKKVKVAVDAKNLEKAEAELKLAFHLIDKNVSKGIVNINAAGRQKASLQALVNSIKK